MPGLQDRPHGSRRDRPCITPDCAFAAAGLLMMSPLRKPDCRRSAFIEAWGELCPPRVFPFESILANPATLGLPDTSRLHLPHLRTRRTSFQPGTGSQKSI